MTRFWCRQDKSSDCRNWFFLWTLFFASRCHSFKGISEGGFPFKYIYWISFQYCIKYITHPTVTNKESHRTTQKINLNPYFLLAALSTFLCTSFSWLDIYNLNITMDQPVVLNEEIPKKYESYSSSVSKETNTLDEPVIDTIVIVPLFRKEMWWKCI